MKSIAKFSLIIFMLSIALSLVVLSQPANSQLVVIGDKYQITKVDVPKSRLEAINYKKKAGIVYILIDGNTKVFYKNKRVRWTNIKVGDIITVHGGLTWDFKVKAKKIYIKSQ